MKLLPPGAPGFPVFSGLSLNTPKHRYPCLFFCIIINSASPSRDNPDSMLPEMIR